MDEIPLMLKAAQLYYHDALTQDRIARALGISRFKVSRLIKEARERGFVQVRIVGPQSRCPELEAHLVHFFPLREAIVVPVMADIPAAIRSATAQAAAETVIQKLKDNCALGIAWGRTLFEVLDFLKPKHITGVRVVQLLGGLGRISNGIYPVELVARAADILGGSCHFLHAPAVVESNTLRDALVNTVPVKTSLEMCKTLDVAIIGVGTLDSDSPLIQSTELLGGDALKALKGIGAVGEICGQFYDADGETCRTEVNDRIIGLGLVDLRKLPCVIGVAGGRNKVPAILGALRAGIFHTLVTDEFTANALLTAERNRLAGAC